MHARALARLRFWLRTTRLAEGDLIELVCDVRYRERVDDDHLPVCPLGTRGIVYGVAPMVGAAGGVLFHIADGTGAPTRYWSGAATDEVRRV